MFASVIHTIIGTKFQINPLIITLCVWAKKPPPPPSVAGEISNCPQVIGLNSAFPVTQRTTCSQHLATLKYFLSLSTEIQDALIHPNDVLRALRKFVEDNREPLK